MYFKTAINEGQEKAIEKTKVLSKPTFSENDFITLLLSKLLDNGISKIDTMKLKYILADYYSDEEYTFLFEDLALKEQVEENYVELDDAYPGARARRAYAGPLRPAGRRHEGAGRRARLPPRRRSRPRRRPPWRSPSREAAPPAAGRRPPRPRR